MESLMPPCLRLLVSLPIFAAFSLAALTAGAASAPEAPPPPPPSRDDRFTGLALYAGGGAGALADIGSLTENFRLLITVPLSRWAMFEGFGFGYHFIAAGHHGREDSLGLGIGVGVRFAKPPESAIRPYGALRFEHVHLSPDLFAPHTGDAGGDSHEHTSLHRWGVALGGGLDTAPFRSIGRLRIGFDAEAMLLSGPGSNVGISGIALIGYAF
jgi:hypothetical protein